MFCTDGVYAFAEQKAMEDILSGFSVHSDLERCADDVIKAAKEGKSTDNMTVALAAVTGD